jgi:hypothetical protein
VLQKTNYNLNRLYATINTKQCNLKVLDKLTLPTIKKKQTIFEIINYLLDFILHLDNHLLY